MAWVKYIIAESIYWGTEADNEHLVKFKKIMEDIKNAGSVKRLAISARLSN